MPYVDFKAIKAAVSIEDTANLLNLPLKTATNCAAIVPHAAMKTNASSLSRRLADSFIASMRKSAEIFGSRPAHIRVGRTRRGRFLIPYRGLLTIPQPPEQKKAAATKKETAFDPVAFASKLQYSQVYIPIRHSDCSISGFVGYAEGQMKLPPKWLPATSNVVTFPKRVRKKSPA